MCSSDLKCFGGDDEDEGYSGPIDLIVFAVVVFPLPLRPMMAWISPAGISSSIPRSIGVSSIPACKLLMSRTGLSDAIVLPQFLAGILPFESDRHRRSLHQAKIMVNQK